MCTTGFLTLVGLKHVGKTSIARAVAAGIPGARVRDIDEEMVRLAREEEWFPAAKGTDPPVRRLYRFLGPRSFASWEAEVILRVLRSRADEPEQEQGTPALWIVSTGGGVCDNARAVELLERSRPILYLWEDPSVLYRRVIRRGIPAFLDENDPKGSFMRLAERRDRTYRTIADQVINVSGLAVEESARLILENTR